MVASPNFVGNILNIDYLDDVEQGSNKESFQKCEHKALSKKDLSSAQIPEQGMEFPNLAIHVLP